MTATRSIRIEVPPCSARAEASQAGHLQGSVWEVRSNPGSRVARVLFAIAGGEIVLLHGFIKKSQRTPADEIALALARWKEWKDAEDQ
ncbi:MAG: type II toxin-antitoxin system RelE/ParE family toxin [Betaproteobacteria bacterium]|nr:type II toxin-antitoxin system RelE/ParE family toxin [Betaproteobacteria bacterium]